MLSNYENGFGEPGMSRDEVFSQCEDTCGYDKCEYQQEHHFENHDTCYRTRFQSKANPKNLEYTCNYIRDCLVTR